METALVAIAQYVTHPVITCHNGKPLPSPVVEHVVGRLFSWCSKHQFQLSVAPQLGLSLLLGLVVCDDSGNQPLTGKYCHK